MRCWDANPAARPAFKDVALELEEVINAGANAADDGSDYSDDDMASRFGVERAPSAGSLPSVQLPPTPPSD